MENVTSVILHVLLAQDQIQMIALLALIVYTFSQTIILV